jgi:collagenase-like PrtC family protease
MYLNLGYNFDKTMPEVLNALNTEVDIEQETSNKITEVYGSDREHAWLAARPDFRLPEVSASLLENHVALLRSYGIDFNYTMNAPYLGSKAKFMNRKLELLEWFYTLIDMGVHRIIISNPMLLEFFHRYARKAKIRFELSTIMHVDTPMQLQAYKRLDPRVDKVVGNILYNRDFKKLCAFVRACTELDMQYEVMVNEFCANTTGQGSEPNMAHCVYRDSCYQCHSENETVEDAKLMQNYPMGKCMSSRNHNPADWLRTEFILPQHMFYYEDIGIKHFKVTGRTAQTPYLKMVASAYLRERFDGNLLELWKPLETIYSGKEELSEHKQHFDIPAKALDGFLAPWFEGKLDCNTRLCSNCHYCDDWYEVISNPHKTPSE